MTEAKQVAKTLTNIIDNPIMKIIMDRSQKINPAVDAVLDHWSYNLFTREPGVAYKITEDGLNERYTTLDMATLLFSLVERTAVINLPEYEPRRQATSKSKEIVVSRENRHGVILGLTSNQGAFTFGARIKDAQVINTGSNEVGAYRTYLATDLDGQLYDGWKSIQFVPTAKENEWFYQKGLWQDDEIVTGDAIKFLNFVTPEKWISFYGKYFIIAKALEQRLAEQIHYMKNLVSEMKSSGLKYPRTTGAGPIWKSDHVATEKAKTEKIWSFQSEIDLPDNNSCYRTIQFSQDNLVTMTKKIKKLDKALVKIRFACRSIDLAFSNKHKSILGSSGVPVHYLLPGWIKNTLWEYPYVEPGKRIKWSRLKLIQPGVGQRSIALRFRWYKKSEAVR